MEQHARRIHENAAIIVIERNSIRNKIKGSLTNKGTYQAEVHRRYFNEKRIPPESP